MANSFAEALAAHSGGTITAPEPTPAPQPAPAPAPALTPEQRTSIFRNALLLHAAPGSPAAQALEDRGSQFAAQNAHQQIQRYHQQTGAPITPEVAQAFHDIERNKIGMPTAEAKSHALLMQEAQQNGAQSSPLENFGKGLRDVGVDTARGMLLQQGALSAEDQDALALAQQYKEAEGPSAMRTIGSVTGATLPLLAAPVSGTVGAGTLGYTLGNQFAPQQGALMDQGVGFGPAFAVTLAKTATMLGAGALPMPTLLGNAAKQGVGQNMLRAGAAGAAQGIVNTGAQQAVDVAGNAIDPNVPVSPLTMERLAEETAGWAIPGAAMGAPARAQARSAAATNINAARGTRMLDPSVAEVWAQDPALAAQTIQPGKIPETAQAAVGRHTLNKQGADRATQAELLRMQEEGEPEVAAAEHARQQATAEQEAKSYITQKHAAEMQDTIDAEMATQYHAERAKKKAEADAQRTKYAEEYTALGDEERQKKQDAVLRAQAEANRETAEARANEERQQALDRANPPVEPEVTYPPEVERRAIAAKGVQTRTAKDEAARPETAPIHTEAWRTDPEVAKAKAHYDQMMASSNADRNAKAMARQSLADAVENARARYRAEAAAAPERPIDTGAESRAEVPPEVGAERPAPKNAPISKEVLKAREIADISRRFKTGEITATHAIEERKAVEARYKESHAVPAQENPARTETSRARARNAGRDTGTGVSPDVRVGRGSRGRDAEGQRQEAPAPQETQRQDQGRGAEEPVEGRGNPVPKPEVGGTNAEAVRGDQTAHGERGNAREGSENPRSENIPKQPEAGRAGTEPRGSAGEKAEVTSPEDAIGDALRAGLKKESGADIGGHKLDIVRNEDGSHTLVGANKQPIAPIRIRPAAKPKDVDAKSWWNTFSARADWRTKWNAIVPKKLRGQFPKDSMDFATSENIPDSVRQKLYRELTPRGAYEKGEIVVHGDDLDRMPRTANHEVEHAVIDNLVPQADKDLLLDGLRKRNVAGADKASSNPKDKDAYNRFLELVRATNERYTNPQHEQLLAKAKDSTGFWAAVKRTIATFKKFLGLAKEAHAAAPDGVEIVIGKLRKGEYAANEAKGEKEKEGKSYSLDEDRGEDEGRARSLHGVEGKKARSFVARIKEKYAKETEERRISDAEVESSADTFEKSQGGLSAAADKIMASSRGADTPEKHEVLRRAISALNSKLDWSPEAMRKAHDMAMEIEAQLSDVGRRLRMGRDTKATTPEERVAELRLAVVRASPQVTKALKALKDRSKNDKLSAKARGQAKAEYDAMLARSKKDIERKINKFREISGIDLRKPESVNYMVDDKAAALAGDMAKKSDFSDTAIAYYRASLLSDPLQTGTQQFIGNLFSLVFERNPLNTFLRNWKEEGGIKGGGKAIAVAAGATAANLKMAMRFGILREALGNATASYKAMENVHVRDVTNVSMGKESGEGHGVMGTDIASEALKAVSYRTMAFADGGAHRIHSRLLEAELVYREAREMGASHKEATEAVENIITGKEEVPHEIQLEAIMQAAPGTFQEYSFPHPYEKTDPHSIYHFLQVMQNAVRAVAVPIPIGRDPVTLKHPRFSIGQIYIPFVKTNVSIAGQAVMKNPLTGLPVYAAKKLSGGYKETVFNPRGKVAEARAFANLATGMTAAAMIAGAMKAGWVTVVGTEQDALRKKLRDDGQLQGEYTLKLLGMDTPIPFKRIEPFATVLASLGNAINGVLEGDGLKKISADTLIPYMRIGENLAWFDATSRIYRAINQRDSDTQPSAMDKATEYFFAQPITALLPAVIKNYTARGDETHRGPNADQIASIFDNYGTELGRYVAEAWGIKDTPARISATGEPVRSGPFAPAESTAGKIAKGAAERVIKGGLGTSIEAQPSKFITAFDKYRQSLPEDLRKEMTMPVVRRSFTDQKEKYTLSAKEYEQFQKTYYKSYNESVAALADELPKTGTEPDDVAYIKKQLERARHFALGDAKDEVLNARKN